MAGTTGTPWRGLFAIWAVVAIVFSVLPPSAMPPTFGISDVLQHAVAYAAGGFLAVMGWHGGRVALIAVCGVITLGAALEIVQHTLIPGRMGEWRDVAANIAGTATGAVLALLRRRVWQRGQFTDP